MKLVREEFKGKDETHVLLNPDDINAFMQINKILCNALEEKFPWNRKDQIKKYIEVANWFKEKVTNCQFNIHKNESISK